MDTLIPNYKEYSFMLSRNHFIVKATKKNIRVGIKINDADSFYFTLTPKEYFLMADNFKEIEVPKN